MNEQTLEISLTINNVIRKLAVDRDESLLDALRRASYFSV